MQHLFKVVCDLETSGSCPINNGIIAACFLIIDQNNNVVDEFVRYVRPPNHERYLWSLEAQGIHGMTFEQVETFMPNDQFCYELLWFLKPYISAGSMPFICHASPGGWFDKSVGKWIIVRWFDYAFLKWAFIKAKFANGNEMVWTMHRAIDSNNLISTVAMGRKAKYKTNKLNQWAERLRFELKHHDATSDTYCCLEVFKFLEANNDGFQSKRLPGTGQELNFS